MLGRNWGGTDTCHLFLILFLAILPLSSTPFLTPPHLGDNLFCYTRGRLQSVSLLLLLLLLLVECCSLVLQETGPVGGQLTCLIGWGRRGKTSE